MLALAPVCVDQYRSHSSLKASLLVLREQYQDMIQSQMILGEENEYFEEMMDLINALHVKLR